MFERPRKYSIDLGKSTSASWPFLSPRPPDTLGCHKDTQVVTKGRHAQQVGERDWSVSHFQVRISVMCRQRCGSRHRRLLTYQVDSPVRGGDCGEGRKVVLWIKFMILRLKSISLGSRIWSC